MADDTGKPLAGVMVVTIAGSSIQEGRSSVFRSVTDENGAYFLPGLPPGTYRICVSDAKDYLDPCQWGPETSINVVDTPANLNLRLRKGARLVVRIADPNGLVAGYKKAVEAAASVPGAFTNVTLSDAEGNSKLVPLTHWADNIYEYSLLLPTGHDFTIVVSNRYFSLVDSSNRSIGPQGYSSTVRLSVPKSLNPLLRPMFGFLNTPATAIDFRIVGGIPSGN